MTSRQPCDSLGLPHALPTTHPYTRPYVCGWRCARHTPSAERGLPEAPPGPGWPIHRQPPPDAEAAASTRTKHGQDPT